MLSQKLKTVPKIGYQINFQQMLKQLNFDAIKFSILKGLTKQGCQVHVLLIHKYKEKNNVNIKFCAFINMVNSIK